MVKTNCVLFLILVLAGCHEDIKTNQALAQKSIATSDTLVQSNKSPDDPYFVLTKDTFSLHGPQNITRSVLQDKKGNIWFASWEGVIGYNGKQFVNYTLFKDLKKFHVFSLLEDRNGNLWFGTIGGGAYRYNGDTFTLFTTKDQLADNTVLCMMEDREGNIWFGTNNGVSRYNGHSFHNFNTKDGLSNNVVNTMLQDKSGTIWIGTFDGISCYNPQTTVWAGEKLFTDFKNKEGVFFNNVRSIIENKNGNILIGTEEGLYQYNAGINTTAQDKSLTSLRTYFTGTVFEDRLGIIWLSEALTDGSGMMLTRFDGTSFVKITSETQVFGITQDATGSIWFGTATGIGCYNPLLDSRGAKEELIMRFRK